MKKKVLNGILFGGVGLLALSSVAAVSLTSCSTTTPAQDATINLYNAYKKDVRAKVGNSLGYVTPDTASAVNAVIKQYTKQATELQKQIQSGGTVDEKIWIDSVVFQLGIEQSYIDTQAYLLGAPIGGNILSAYDYTNAIADYAESMKYADDYESCTSTINDFMTATDAIRTDLSAGMDQNHQVTLSGIMLKLLVNDTLKRLYIPQLEAYSKLNVGEKPVNNTGGKTNIISQIGQSSFFEDFITKNEAKLNLTADNKTTLTELAKKADAKIDSFVEFLLGQYWSNVHYGWTSKTTTPDSYQLSVVANNASNNTEVTGAYIVPERGQPNTILGLGITQDELNTPNIGIGFTPGPKTNPNAGLNIYQNYLLHKNTTIYDKAIDVVNEGMKNVNFISSKMSQIDQFLAPLLASKDNGTLDSSGNWIPKGYHYNSDIFKDGGVSDFDKLQDVTGTGLATKKTDGTWTVSPQQLKNFFNWLNCEEWFFGRDAAGNQVITLPSEATNLGFDIYFEPNNAGKDGQGVLIAGNQPTIQNADSSNNTPAKNNGAKYSFDMKYAPEIGTAKITDEVTNNFGDAGDLYTSYVVKSQGIKPGAGLATMSGAQAYAGTSFAMDSYNRLSKAVLPSVTEIFIKSADSDVHAPTKLDLHTNIITGTGGAAYANGRTFFLDVNPYFGLQKWSMTTLLSHESLPGHNLQMIYAIDNTSSKFAPRLRYNSYAEGWGLFSEWLATQYGAYGQPQTITGKDWQDVEKRLQLPDFADDYFGNSKTFSTVNINIKEANAQISNGEFMNGSFETDYAGQSTTDSESLNQSYYNAMEYFGFLNERQLRAMRMVLDTSIHAGGPTITNGEINADTTSNVGDISKKSGWSLQNEVDYMAANSALGQGDKYREAQRYLNYVGQATSYLPGEIVMEQLYGNACAAYAQANDNKQFMDYTNLVSTQNNTAPYFNLILRNGNIPLPVLEKYVTEYINQNIGAIPGTQTQK